MRGDEGKSIYLAELTAVFSKVAELLPAGGHAVLNPANLVTAEAVTPLASDTGRQVSQYLALRQDVFLCQDQQPPRISADYCLIIQKTDA